MDSSQKQLTIQGIVLSQIPRPRLSCGGVLGELPVDVADVAGDGDAEPSVIPFAMASFTRSTSSIFSKQSCRKLGGPDPFSKSAFSLFVGGSDRASPPDVGFCVFPGTGAAHALAIGRHLLAIQGTQVPSGRWRSVLEAFDLSLIESHLCLKSEVRQVRGLHTTD